MTMTLHAILGVYRIVGNFHTRRFQFRFPHSHIEPKDNISSQCNRSERSHAVGHKLDRIALINIIIWRTRSSASDFAYSLSSAGRL